MIRVGVNGFGRIGRALVKAWCGSAAGRVAIVAVNDVADANTLAHLYRYDSVHGSPPGVVAVRGEHLVLGGRSIRCFHDPDPGAVPWRAAGVDVVVEATGQFRDRAGAVRHLAAGVSSVIVTAPMEAPDVTWMVGINDEDYDPKRHRIISAGSCTAHAVAPLLAALDGASGWRSGFMTTVHPMTGDQRIQDAPHPDLRRARAAAAGIIPTTSSAVDVVRRVLPDLGATFDGMAYRVPTLLPAVVDVVAQVRRPTHAAAVNAVFRVAAAAAPHRIGVCDEPLVAADFAGETRSTVVDTACTSVTADTQVHLTAWYDNEAGYAQRLLELVSATRSRAVRGGRTRRETAAPSPA